MSHWLIDFPILDTRYPILYTPPMAYKPVVLIIVDGFGVAPPADGNAVNQAKMPVFRHLIDSYPAMTVQANGAAVGLSWGEMGNSEVGHLNIGAGRVVGQDITRIDMAIGNGSFFTNQVLLNSINASTTNTVHIMGLLSDGGVHSHINHIFALIKLASDLGKKVWVHAYETKPLDTTHDTYIKNQSYWVQIDAEVPCE